jgi:hypothetical protein
MHLMRILTWAVLLVFAVAAQDSGAVKDLWLRFGNAATTAEANFRSADSIERHLVAGGNTLHPVLAALRLRIESSLNESEAELKKGDLESATQSISRAEGLLDRFSRVVGGF